MKNGEQRGTMMVGFAVLGLIVVGVGSALAAIVALFAFSDFIGGGVFALASAFAFGQLLTGLFRS